MNSIKGLLVKDFLLLKSYIRNIIICIGLFATIIFSDSSSDMSIVGVMMIMLLFSMLVLTTFSYDERQHADRYLLTLPISRKDMVIEKYILAVITLIMGVVIGTLISMGLTYFLLGKSPNLEEMFSATMGCMVAVVFLQAVQIPCIYKWGAEKGRMQIYIVGMIVFVIGILLSTFAPKLQLDFSVFNNYDFLIPVFFLILMALFYFVSYKLSNKIVNKKDF